MRPDTAVPGVVVNMTDHGGLGIARSLGRLGVAVHAVHDRKTPACSSRYVTQFHRFDGDMGDDRLVPFLVALAGRLGERPVLFVTGDPSSLLVDRHLDELGAVFRVPRQPRGLAARLSDKRGMYELCLEHQVPTPRSAFPTNRSEVEAAIDELGTPAVFKLMDSSGGAGAGAERTIIGGDRNELLAAYDALPPTLRAAYLLQEYVPGDPTTIWMFNGYFDDSSRPLVGYTGQKVHQCPPATGPTSLGVCAANDDVARLTTRFMAGVGYRGILDCGYRFDRRDGLYKLLDVNPRVGATFRLFVGDDSADVVRAQYLDLTGQPVPPSKLRAGRRWVAEPNEAVSFIESARDGGVSPGAWVRAYRGVEELAWWAADDVRPFAATAAESVSRLVRWGGRQLHSKSRPGPRPPLALAYHAVGDMPVRHDPNRLFTRPADLVRQVRALRWWGYELVSFGQLAERVAGGEGDGLAALTFDDGFEDNLTVLAPMLAQLGVPATVFVVSSWDGRPHPDGPGRALTRAQIVQLARTGVEIGSHGRSHVDLTTLPYDQVVENLRVSRRELSELVDRPVDVLAYPHGRASPETRRAAGEAGFRAACRTSGNGSWADPFDLPRQDMQNHSTMVGLWLKRDDRYEALAATVPGRLMVAARRRVLARLG